MSRESEGRRRQMEKSAEKAEEEKRRELFRRRLDIAKNGLKSYQLHRIGEAAVAFHTYIKVLEDWKRVPDGELNPTLFHPKEEAGELLLLTGVYWDLAKMYDRTKNRQKEFQHYLGKYVIFSKGTAYQQMSVETLRKYIAKGAALHPEAFRQAFVELGGGKCFVVTSLLDVTDEATLCIFRDFRDGYLVRHQLGRLAVDAYYRVSPKMVPWIDRLPRYGRVVLGKSLDQLARTISTVCRFEKAESSTDFPKN